MVKKVHRSNEGIKLLCIKLLQMSGYARYFDNDNKSVNILVNDKKLLKEYNAVWDKISSLGEKGFDSKPVYHNEHLRAEIKLYNGRINTNLHSNKIPEKNMRCVSLSVCL